MRNRHARQEGERGVVVHLILAEDSTVPVVGIVAEAQVRDDEKLGQLVLQRANGVLNDTLVVVAGCSEGVFGFGDSEEEYARDA